ncbi:hypothetical protein [Burkholderia cenocepacia]|uniref:hypothetical protein n=1 Tax=Burkholderia cenocepacia TaxID=95486 RepID=UPI0015C3E76F|nr:hypothetical protein [Burkholderia cenocepacia]
MTPFGYLLDCLDLELIRVPLAAHADLLGCHKLWLEDVYERLASPNAGTTPRAFPQHLSINLRACYVDYLHLANDAFADCSIPNLHPDTYRSDVG